MANAREVAFRLVTSVHEAVLRASSGRLGGRVAGMPVLILATVGRRSGRRRTTVLTAPVQDGERIVLVASYGGAPRHPAWFLNLRERPRVEVTMDGRTRPMRARVASEAESAALWPRVVSAYRGYAGYQRRTSRSIPLVVLEPCGLPSPG